MKPDMIFYDEFKPEKEKPMNRAERRQQFRYLQKLMKHREKRLSHV